MATLRQKKLAKGIADAVANGETPTKGELLKGSDYSTSTQKRPKKILESKGLQEELEVLGFSTLTAQNVLAGILDTPTVFEMVTPSDQIRAAQEVFKFYGAYAPEKRVMLNLNATISTEARELADRLIKLH